MHKQLQYLALLWNTELGFTVNFIKKKYSKPLNYEARFQKSILFSSKTKHFFKIKLDIFLKFNQKNKNE